MAQQFNLYIEKKHLKKGKEEGEIIEQDTTGKIITKGSYINGKEGSWYYYVNDHKEEGSFVDDLQMSDKSLTVTDKFLFEGSFINGIPIDKHTYYYKNGKIRETVIIQMVKKMESGKNTII